jgi:hypothetical protein
MNLLVTRTYVRLTSIGVEMRTGTYGITRPSVNCITAMLSPMGSK